MARTLKFAALAAALMLSATIVGASAFTSAEITRDANINVQNDADGVVQLSSGVGTTMTSGKLTIDLDNLNEKSTFEFGEKGGSYASDSDNFAFSLSTSDGSDHSIGFDYSDGATNNVTFYVYDSSGNKKAEITEGTKGSFDLPSEETNYVVVEITTPDDVDSDGEDFTGTLTITANPASA